MVVHSAPENAVRIETDETRPALRAVILAAGEVLHDFAGNLLILYGDTFQPVSLRGMPKRHDLKKAHLTLLTAAATRDVREIRARSCEGEYRLTVCVHQLIRSGLQVESYRVYDPDEVQGINGADDFGQAEVVPPKRCRWRVHGVYSESAPAG